MKVGLKRLLAVALLGSLSFLASATAVVPWVRGYASEACTAEVSTPSVSADKSGKEKCLERIRQCQQECARWYKGDALAGCRANCGNAGSCG